MIASAANSPLPSFTGVGAIDWIIYVAALLTALAVIWRYAMRPTIKAFNNIDEYGPVISEIAKQFKNNSGSTLKDTLDRLEANTTRCVAGLAAAEARGREQAQELADLTKSINEIKATLKPGGA